MTPKEADWKVLMTYWH